MPCWRTGPQRMPEVGQVEYRAGFRRGYICGMFAGALVVGILAKVLA